MTDVCYRKTARIIARKEACQVCTRTWDLVVHHRDHDVSNNDLSNLVCLCMSCHGIQHGIDTRSVADALKQGLTYEAVSLKTGVCHRDVIAMHERFIKYKAWPSEKIPKCEKWYRTMIEGNGLGVRPMPPASTSTRTLTLQTDSRLEVF